MPGGGADPSVLGSSAAAASVAAAPIGVAREGGGEVGSNSGTDEDKRRGDRGGGDRCFGGGNRWPRQETLALLKIRSDMDQVFRDSSLKGPLWEDVSRKLAELDYNRSSKKCKEKFENLYKYHKRTKDQGRAGKSDGKHYKFFDQLAAFDHHNHQPQPPPPKPQTPMQTTPPTLWPNIAPPPPPTAAAAPPAANPTISAAPPKHNISADLFFSSTSSSTDSDEETGYVGDDKIRERKWKVFFKRVTKQVIRKQEELQDKFLEAIEKRDHERTVREEAWRVQELARINREHEILIQERSTAAAKDAAVIAFLQKISGQGQQQQQNPPHIAPSSLASRPPPPPPLEVTNNGVVQSSSRWPKIEIEALIRLRTDLSLKYQENGPKGPLWEEISAAMRGLGYNRSAKRCKEKWENINKYFKKVKYSNKKRPEDSKTCPYFEQLDALYREKNTMVPLMVQPEQQWPLQHENVNQTYKADDEEDSEEQGGDYEIVANKAASMAATGE